MVKMLCVFTVGLYHKTVNFLYSMTPAPVEAVKLIHACFQRMVMWTQRLKLWRPGRMSSWGNCTNWKRLWMAWPRRWPPQTPIWTWQSVAASRPTAVPPQLLKASQTWTQYLERWERGNSMKGLCCTRCFLITSVKTIFHLPDTILACSTCSYWNFSLITYRHALCAHGWCFGCWKSGQHYDGMMTKSINLQNCRSPTNRGSKKGHLVNPWQGQWQPVLLLLFHPSS